MRNKTEGIRGESLAEGYLVGQGYKIIETNAKLMGIEVDIIAEAQDGVICFIEVKSRETNRFGTSIEAVTAQKIRRYRQFINLYAQIKRLSNRDMRIDVIAISGNEVEHLVDVY